MVSELISQRSWATEAGPARFMRRHSHGNADDAYTDTGTDQASTHAEADDTITHAEAEAPSTLPACCCILALPPRPPPTLVSVDNEAFRNVARQAC